MRSEQVPGSGGGESARPRDRAGLRRALVWGLAALALAEAAALAVIAARARWQAAAGGQVQRGQRVAERMGCFGCHGPGGTGGIPDPGSKAGDVPPWVGGSWMMYNREPADVRAWILDGHPPGRRPEAGALIEMPAFRFRMSDAELADLTVYVLTVSQFGDPADPRATAGRDAALRFGCFGCHGPEGRGLVADPGSLKGYVPAWDGADYAELVHGDDELRQWVWQGITDRFRANPVARRFVEREAIKMPAFGKSLAPGELDALTAYIHWVRQHPRTAPPPPSAPGAR